MKEKDENVKIQEKRSQKNNREFVVVTYFFLALFLCLIGYIVSFQVLDAETIINNPYNKRQTIFANSIIRGKIISSDRKVLAKTIVNSSTDKETRIYPNKNMFAHAIGYSTNGTTGVESIANFQLLRTHSFIGNQLMNMINQKKNRGDTVVTTFSHRLQQTAYTALGGYEGAVVAIDPETGKILTMVSKPDFDPNQIATNYKSIVGEDDSSKKNSVLFNRATQGSYTPGSTFKIFTTLEYFHEQGSNADYHYQCTGTKTVDQTSIHCYGGEVHGDLDLQHMFAESCNCGYATMGLSLNLQQFGALTKRMLFDRALPIEYPYTKSKFSLTKDSTSASIMMGSFGQDKITVSPIHLAMVASAISNKGTLMKPYVVDHVENDAKTIVTKNKPTVYKQLLSKECAKAMRKLMRATVDYGTATALQSTSYRAAGKTGSAQVSDSSDDTHSWFVGYAKHKGKSIAIAVIVEKQGNGSRFAVPIAKKVFDAYFD
ncbi:peptidoglycan glycosyltransferase [Lachnospiraceae bacterium XBB1006]|nr:peptidoglycan glycosyltransferase [Lachnospiraceae bacterium XBB1006]